MTTINATTSSQIANSQTLAAQQANKTASSKTVANESSETPASSDKVEISTRAQKIQTLNEEFFSNGIESFTISSTFIKRLEELGFITSNEASNLGSNINANESGGNSTVGEVSKFINSFTASLKKADPDNSLIDTLQQAKTILTNFNNPTQSSKNINTVQISSQLQNYIGSHTEQLSETNKSGLNQLVSVLNIANKLTPGKNTTSEIDSYLAINKL